MTLHRGIVGVILAGGTGSRLGGVDKARLRLEGISLTDRAIARFKPQCGALLFSVAQTASETALENFSAQVLPDRSDGPTGPAAALWAGLRWTRANAPDSMLLTGAVDCPFLPLDFARQCLDAIGDSGCITGAYDGQIYPTHALWSPDALESALSDWKMGGKGPSLFALIEKAHGRHIDYRKFMRFNPFQGINTLADLLEVSARMRNLTSQNISF